MGFTRYWEFSELDKEKFKDFSSICQVLVDNMNIPLEDVTINEKQVRFNGVDDDAHETFYFSLDKPSFNFCKTNVKPYDVVVCGCLYVAKMIFRENIRVSQDCDESEDLYNINLITSIIRNNKLNQLLCID